MAKIRKESNAAISLFPFLSILACTIGTLILILAGMVLGQIGKGASYKQLKVNKEYTLQEIDELGKKISTANILQKRLKEYEKEAEEKGLPPSPDVIKRLLTLPQEKKALEQSISKLKTDIDRAKKLLDVAEENRRKAEGGIIHVQLELNGVGKGLTPYFIECKADGLIIHPKGEFVPKMGIEWIDNSFRTLAEKIRGDDKGCVLFLIRPSGIETFRASQKVVKEPPPAKYGYNAVPESAELRFTQ